MHALTLQESVVLARELPNLRALLHLDPGPVSADPDDVRADRILVRRTLEVIRGHPTLLKFADAAAADPAVLADHLVAVARSGQAHNAVLTAFFASGTSGLGAADFLAELALWTRAAVARLPDSPAVGEPAGLRGRRGPNLCQGRSAVAGAVAGRAPHARSMES